MVMSCFCSFPLPIGKTWVVHSLQHSACIWRYHLVLIKLWTWWFYSYMYVCTDTNVYLTRHLSYTLHLLIISTERSSTLNVFTMSCFVSKPLLPTILFCSKWFFICPQELNLVAWHNRIQALLSYHLFFFYSLCNYSVPGFCVWLSISVGKLSVLHRRNS